MVPNNLTSMSDADLLCYIERAVNEFRYQAQLHFAIHHNRTLQPNELDDWMASSIRMIEAMMQVASEVYNGGFLQYFDNSCADSATLAIISGYSYARNCRNS